MQNHYNLVYREEEREMLPLCRDQGVGVMPWSPLARGRLAGNRGQATGRAETDEFGKSLYPHPGRRLRRRRSGGRSPGTAGSAGAGGAGLAARRARGDRADRRGHEAEHLDDAVAAVDVELTETSSRGLEEPYVPHPISGHQ